jgi:hypothetical protein
MAKRVTVHDIKQALLDERFRTTLPVELTEDVQKFLKNPNCGCHNPIFLKVMRLAGPQVASYFPTKEADADEMEKDIRMARNRWQVINCSVTELEERLKKMGNGRKQIEIARWQDQVTVVINHLETV